MKLLEFSYNLTYFYTKDLFLNGIDKYIYYYTYLNLRKVVIEYIIV